MELLPDLQGTDYRAELRTAITAARAGAAAIMPVYLADEGFAADAKSDGSPVTVADLASDAAIRRIISAAFPDDGLLTEEGLDDRSRLTRSRVWIADPLDGTREFVARTDDFDVFVGLVVDGVPTVAVSCHPPSGQLLYAVAGHGAWSLGEDGSVTRVTLPRPIHAIRVVTSPYFGAPAIVPTLEAALADLPCDHVAVIGPGFHPRHFVPVDGGAPLFDVFVAGVSDAWLSGGEWDAVVTDLFVREAGGMFSDLWGEPYAYNKPIARNAFGYVASVEPQLHLDVLAHLRHVRPAEKPDNAGW
jgi:3'-phosphoadenosine 5'-phosphosulfate (PAPS) 3'-phosphatase